MVMFFMCENILDKNIFALNQEKRSTKNGPVIQEKYEGQNTGSEYVESEQ
jgi:hypothetical protein